MNRWNPQLDRITRAVETEFGSISVEQLRERPDPERWSIAETLRHIILLNESYFPILDSVREGGWHPPALARIPGLPGLIKSMIGSAVQPDRKRRMKTFAPWDPVGSEIPADIIGAFVEHQSRLKEQIAMTADRAAHGVIIHSPVNRHLVYPLDGAFDIIVSHEERHLEQCREILKRMEGGEITGPGS